MDSSEKSKAHNFSLRRTRTSSWRLALQSGFTLLCLALGWQFACFVEAARSPGSGPLPVRPPGVEGFLPISGLMGTIDWFHQGILNPIHPAATVLFLLFLVISLILRKAFCGWICPVGFLSENMARAGKLLRNKWLRLPSWLDILLQSLKYLLLGFFCYVIFSMSAKELNDFIHGPYNQVADIKMLDFFLTIGTLGIAVLVILALLSILFRTFWCRYLCPYGALLGLFSWLSPVKVRRDPNTCIQCKACEAACPAWLKVSEKPMIRSVECIGCLDCVVSCPVPGCLRAGLPKGGLTPRRFTLILISLFLAGYLAARVTGHWTSSLTDAEIRYHVERMDGPEYGHPGR